MLGLEGRRKPREKGRNGLGGQDLSPRARHLVQGRGNTAIDGEHVVAQGRPISKAQLALGRVNPHHLRLDQPNTPSASQRAEIDVHGLPGQIPCDVSRQHA